MGMYLLFDSMILLSYILLVLHPRHKLKYFKNVGWEQEWIDKAEEIVRSEFDKSYGLLDASWAENLAIKPKVRVFSILDRLFYIKVLYYSFRPPPSLPYLKTYSTTFLRFKHPSYLSCLVSLIGT